MNDDKYHKAALSIAESCSYSTRRKKHDSDLLSGVSGIIVGLLHLHSHYKKDWILDDIELWLNELLADASLSRRGLYFDRDPFHPSGLCGFAHGGAGIAFALFELGNYLKNSAFYNLANLVMLHESSYYEPQTKNWADLRHFEDNTHLLTNQYKRHGEFLKMPKVREATFWCNGAPGILLAAMRGQQLCENQQYKRVFNAALTTTKRSVTRLKNYSLCHGSAGNGLILFEVFRQTSNREALKAAVEVAQKITHTPKELLFKKEAYYYLDSLFTGPAGVGYYALIMSGQTGGSSLINPLIRNESSGGDHSLFKKKVDELNITLLKNTYPKTSFFISNKLKRVKISNRHFRRSFNKSVKEVVRLSSIDYIEDVFVFEQYLQQIRYAHDNNYLIAIRNEVERENSKKLLSQNFFKNERLVLSPSVFLIKTKWDWIKKNGWKDSPNVPPAIYFILAIRGPMGSKEYMLGKKTFQILKTFKKPIRLYQALLNLKVIERQQRKSVTMAVKWAIKNLIIVKHSKSVKST
jgi:hypothetical protein